MFAQKELVLQQVWCTLAAAVYIQRHRGAVIAQNRLMRSSRVASRAQGLSGRGTAVLWCLPLTCCGAKGFMVGGASRVCTAVQDVHATL